MLNFFNKKECQEIAYLFSLGRVKSIKPIRQGFWTPKVKVFTTKGGFVFSRYRIPRPGDLIIKSKSSLHHEIDLLNHLKGLPTLKYFKSKNGNYIEEFKNSWVTVDRLIPGKNPKKITNTMAYQLGEFLGKFHQRGKSFRKISHERRRFYYLPKSLVLQMGKIVLRNKNSILKGVIQEVKKGVLKYHPSGNLPTGPIHVDLKPENELFVGEKLQGVVDFGNFYNGPLILDVGKTIMWNCSRNKKLDLGLVERFIDGYTNKRSLSADEKSYLKSSILFAIYSHIWQDLYNVPIKYIPESYTVSLVKDFLPVARELEVLWRFRIQKAL